MENNSLAPGSADQFSGENTSQQSGEAVPKTTAPGSIFLHSAKDQIPSESPISGETTENTVPKLPLQPISKDPACVGTGKNRAKKIYRGTKAKPIKTPKRYRSFVDAYLANGCNSRRAFELTYGYIPSGGGNATRVKQSETVGQELKKHWDEQRLKSVVTVENVIGRLAELSESAARDADKVRCLELLGKYLDLWKFDTPQHQTLIVTGDLDQIRARIAARKAELTSPQPITQQQDSNSPAEGGSNAV